MTDRRYDRETLLVWVVCAMIVALSAAITFWTVMGTEEKKNQPPKPAKLDRVYVSQKTCECGHYQGAHEAVDGECGVPNCECLEFAVRNR